MAVREPPKDVLKMASGLISPSGLAGHRRQLCTVLQGVDPGEEEGDDLDQFDDEDEGWQAFVFGL